MFVSGVVVSAALGGILIVAFAAAVLLAYIDKRCDKQRVH